MIKNYLKVAVRNILRYKFFSTINILGMTIGITACLLIILYVQDELSYDHFNRNADRIYQVNLRAKLGGQDVNISVTCPPMAAALTSEVPEVESSTRIYPMYGKVGVKHEDKTFIEPRVYYADSNFFHFFDYVLLEGDPNTALTEPGSVVITKRIAKKYFGDEQPMGKLMIIGGDNRAYKVTGISENSPSNSHFRYDFLLSTISTDQMQTTMWLNNFMYTYFTLRPNASLSGVSEKLKSLTVKYVGPELEKLMGISLKQLVADGGAFGYYPTAVTDIHLRSNASDALTPSGNISYVYGFGTIAIFIMVIACINFMNMSTARSASRAKEVGLRKTLGSLRGQMIWQFLAESMIYSLAAMLLALAATWFLIPGFNSVAAKELEANAILHWKFLSGVVGVVIFVGLAAGSYPAFYLTSFNVVEVLKGKVRAGVKSQGVRSGLVVFQFGVSILLIIGTAVVFNQISFLRERDMGFDKNNIVYVYNMDLLKTGSQAFRNEMLLRRDVVAASFTDNAFPGINNSTTMKGAGDEQDHLVSTYHADYENMNVMKFKIVKGRYFSKDFPSDSAGVIINEATAKEFGWKDPTSEKIIYNDQGKQFRYNVIGVFKDFNFESLKDRVRPLVIFLNPSSNLLAIRYSGNPAALISAVEDQWKKFSAGEPLEYRFLDQNYDELFRSEQRVGKIVMIFSALAIFIACLGLFALAAFTAEQRTKEIGIRKSMGASVSGLAMMMSGEFIKLVLIAFAIFAGPAWWLADRWLNEFTFRAPISPWIFIVSGLSAVLVAWLTVSVQSFKAASADPVKSLRYE